MFDRKSLGAIWLEFSQIESLDDCLLDTRAYVMRSMFLEALIDRAPFVLQDLLTEVGPVYDQACDEIRADPRRYNRFLLALSPLYQGGRGITIRPTDWTDRHEPVISNLGAKIEAWSRKYRIPLPWVHTFALACLAARHHVLPVHEGTGERLKESFFGTAAANLRNEQCEHAPIAMSFNVTLELHADMSDADLRAQYDAQRTEHLEVALSRLHELRHAIGGEKREFEHFDWLIQYQVCDREYDEVEISNKKSERGRTLDAIRRGIHAAAEEIGLELRPPKRTRNRDC